MRERCGSAARLVTAALAVAIAGLAATPARAADPYRWCAEYGGDMGGTSSCYFHTLDQCRAAISGNGGFCRQNPYYTGAPEGLPGRAKPRR